MRPHRSLATLAAGVTLAAVSGLATRAEAVHFQVGWPGTVQIVDEDDGSLRLRISDDGRTIKAQAKGHFEFTDDEADFASISPGGWFWIEDRRSGRTRHRIEVRSAAGGGIERKYEVGGDAHEFDAEGRTWLADALGVIFSHTTFAAEDHIERLVKRSGVDGALDEIGKMESDHMRREAYGYLLEAVPNDPSVYRRVAEQAAKTMGSDHELAELVLHVVERQPDDQGVLGVCVEATRKIGSDHEHRRALGGVLDPGKPSNEVLVALFDSAKGIGSDHERAELLMQAVENRRLDASLAPAFFAAVDGIGSDHESGRVMSAVLDPGELEPAVLRPLLVTTRGIGSDHEKAAVLMDVVERQTLDASLRSEFLETARGIGSDHERGMVMDRLQSHGL